MADPNRLSRRLRIVSGGTPRSPLDELLAARIPIHFGGMSDPFSPIELKKRTTLELLEILNDYKYPTIISTKSTLICSNEYIHILRGTNFVVQMSITCADDDLAAKFDVGAPSTSERLEVVTQLSRLGIKTAIRHQPLIPTLESGSKELVYRAFQAGARHISVEYLKLPIEEKWGHRQSLSAAAKIDLSEFYASHGAVRVGREWVLPVEYRLPTILGLRNLGHSLGLSFGAADNDLLHLSDGKACCSGADLFGLGTGFEFNFLSAVRGGLTNGEITFGKIQRAWRPKRSIGQFLNSHSRTSGATVDSFIRARWNGVSNGPSPLTFYGVSDSGLLDEDGFKKYQLSRKIRLLSSDIFPTADV